MALKFEHEKSNQVDKALKAGEQFREADGVPAILWLPIVLIGITAIDYFMLTLNTEFADQFFRGDSSWSFLGGVALATVFGLAGFFFFLRRRLGFWLLLAALVLEAGFVFFLQCGGDWGTFLLNAYVPVIGSGPGQGEAGLAASQGPIFFARDAVMLVAGAIVWPKFL